MLMSAKKKNLVPLFGVAFVVAIVSTGIFYGLFVGRLDSAAATAVKPTGTVLVANRAIPQGTVLKAEDISEAPWAAPSLPAGVISASKDAVGKTLVLQVAANELVTKAHLGIRDDGVGNVSIPNGMRAISIQVQDSAGVVSMLKPGNKVDVQVVATIAGGQFNEPQIRTVLEDIQVLSVPADLQTGRGPYVLTLLATPQEASVLGLADSTAKVRVVLRNPRDQKRENLQAVGLGAVFRGNPLPAPTPSAVASPIRSAWRPPSDVRLWIRLTGMDDRAGKEMTDKLDNSGPSQEQLQVTALRTDAGLEESIVRWQGQKSADILASSRLLVSPRTQAAAQWSLNEDNFGLRVQFSPISQVGQRMRLRVHPEVTVPGNGVVARRQLETEIEVMDGQSFIVRGWTTQAEIPLLWNKLFPARSEDAGKRDLMLVVTPSLAPKV